MKKFSISLIAALTVALSACGTSGDSSETATTAPTTNATSSTSSPTSTTTATPSETPTEQDDPAPAGDYPAQADMQQQGANADRVNRFQDNQGRYWLCDKATPQGNPEVPEYNTPNGCMGPFNTVEELQDGLYGAMADALADEFDINTETLAPPTPEAVNSDDIADGIAEDLGCEGATMNEDGSYSYYGCEE
ncbi:hypothetical protein [Corynebacterium minutissimum]|uniref:Secreted protein n=1 Tax=Corynebacterium minutissimum TaxID=38301 RepID=A0A376CWC5_9CORY|nr:hypothetical protein [Corynebacterium minutissimum]QRP60562.1 hypothetical protein I6J26_10435 [Corynebacterium minutissimum]STC76311.1 Uncharacterised protein [Corynebacterium minutissimum]